MLGKTGRADKEWLFSNDKGVLNGRGEFFACSSRNLTRPTTRKQQRPARRGRNRTGQQTCAERELLEGIEGGLRRLCQQLLGKFRGPVGFDLREDRPGGLGFHHFEDFDCFPVRHMFQTQGGVLRRHGFVHFGESCPLVLRQTFFFRLELRLLSGGLLPARLDPLFQGFVLV